MYICIYIYIHLLRKEDTWNRSHTAKPVTLLKTSYQNHISDVFAD